MTGMSRSLESVLGVSPDRSQGGAGSRVDLRRPTPVQQVQDPRRFSDASIPPPRPPPPSIKRPKPPTTIRDRRPNANHNPGPWAPPPHPHIFPQQFPQQPQQFGLAGNLAKMAILARSTPQLDDSGEREMERERDRERERERVRERYPPQVQLDKESLIAQVQQAVHGVTSEEVQKALHRNEWNPVKAEQQLKMEQLYFMSLCSREDCQRILSRYHWDLQQASRYLIRMAREDRTGGERV